MQGGILSIVTQAERVHERATVVYVVAALGLIFTAAQVAPEGARRLAVVVLMVVAALVAPVAHRARGVVSTLGWVLTAIALVTTLFVATWATGKSYDESAPTPIYSPSPSVEISVRSSPTGAMSPSPSTPRARPDGPKQDRVLHEGSTSEFFGGRFLVGAEAVYSSWVVLNLSLRSVACTSDSLSVGESEFYYDRPNDVTYVVTVLRIHESSVDIRVFQRFSDLEEYGSSC